MWCVMLSVPIRIRIWSDDDGVHDITLSTPRPVSAFSDKTCRMRLPQQMAIPMSFLSIHFNGFFKVRISERSWVPFRFFKNQSSALERLL